MVGIETGTTTGGMPKRARTFAEYLRRWLDEHEITQRELASELPGVSESRVSRWVNGHDVPPLRYRADVAERLGLPYAELEKFCFQDRKVLARAEIRNIERAVARLSSWIDPD